MAARISPHLITLLGALLLSGCAGPDPRFADSGLKTIPGVDAGLCIPRNNGVIAADEITLRAGLKARYRVNPPGTVAPVDIVGKILNGVRRWDFSATDGEVMDATLAPLTGSWFAERFPEASFAVAANKSGELLQVVRYRDGELTLLGLASKTPDRTLMIYDTAVTLLRFPMREGDRYQSEGQVRNGKLEGLTLSTRDSYRVRVDARGTLRLPFVELENVLRVRVNVTSMALGGAAVTTRQVQWFAACYGEIVRAVSRADESSADFGQAVELRRLSF